LEEQEQQRKIQQARERRGELHALLTMPSLNAVAAVSRMPLHLAITNAIATLPKMETKRQIARQILLVGGGALLPSIVDALEDRLIETIPYLGTEMNTVEVHVDPKGVGACGVSWKGAAILARSDAVRDLWMNRTEYVLHGIRLIRERAPFFC